MNLRETDLELTLSHRKVAWILITTRRPHHSPRLFKMIRVNVSFALPYVFGQTLYITKRIDYYEIPLKPSPCVASTRWGALTVTLTSTPSTFNPQPSNLHKQPSTQLRRHPALSTQHSTLNMQNAKRNTQHSTLNTQHSTLNTQHSTLNTQHSTLNT